MNQRALIDKVLARYSGEFTGARCPFCVHTIHIDRWLPVFRELLQNSDDASAKAVEIHFDTEAYVNRTNAPAAVADGSQAGPSTALEKLPDLKTAVVRSLCSADRKVLTSSSPGAPVVLQERRHRLPRRGLEPAQEDRFVSLSFMTTTKSDVPQLRETLTKRRSVHSAWVRGPRVAR